MGGQVPAIARSVNQRLPTPFTHQHQRSSDQKAKYHRRGAPLRHCGNRFGFGKRPAHLSGLKDLGPVDGKAAGLRLLRPGDNLDVRLLAPAIVIEGQCPDDVRTSAGFEAYILGRGGLLEPVARVGGRYRPVVQYLNHVDAHGLGCAAGFHTDVGCDFKRRPADLSAGHINGHVRRDAMPGEVIGLVGIVRLRPDALDNSVEIGRGVAARAIERPPGVAPGCRPGVPVVNLNEGKRAGVGVRQQTETRTRVSTMRSPSRRKLFAKDHPVGGRRGNGQEPCKRERQKKPRGSHRIGGRRGSRAHRKLLVTCVECALFPSASAVLSGTPHAAPPH